MVAAARSHVPWVLVGVLGAIALGSSTANGETVNALSIVVASVAVI